MKRTILLVLSILLVPSILVAAPADDALPIVSAVASANPELCETSAPAKIWTTPDFGAFSNCTATCWGGSTTVTCSGSSCTADDSTCNPKQIGSCWSDEEGYKFCPDHPCVMSCSEGPTCNEVHGSFCKTSSGTCYEPALDCREFTCSCWNGTYVCP